MIPAARTVTVPPPCESRARDPETVALTRVVRLPGRTADVCQVSACVPERGSHSP